MNTRSWPTLSAQGSVGHPRFVTEFDVWNQEQQAAAQHIEQALDGVDLVHLAYADPHGLARSKTLTRQAFRTVLRNGMNFSSGPFVLDSGHAVTMDLSDATGIGVQEITGAGNFILVPDPLTFMVLPGRQSPRTAWVLGDEYLRDGTPHPLSGRNVLRQVAARYARRDLTPVLGLEVEWYLTRRLPGPPGNAGNGFGLQGAAPRVEAVNAGYQFNLDSRYESIAPVVNPLAALLVELGLPLRSMEHESGPGQVETTFSPMGALDTADAMLLFRTLAKQLAMRLGYHASFMSLPAISGFDPSGWHLNQSVLDGAGHNLFSAHAGPAAMSPASTAYARGLLARARDLCLLSVPTVNGYRRFGADFALAPTRVGWSSEDRTAMLRIVGTGSSAHIENRVAEPAANPYLAIAAQLSAGLSGLCPPDTPGTAPGVPAGAAPGAAPGALPQSLGEALEAFRRGPAAAELLGAPLAACLAGLKQSEADRFESWRDKEQPPQGAVTDWEQREYFEAF